MTAIQTEAGETAPRTEGPVLPVGDADFADIRRRGAFYADKTDLLHRLVRFPRPYFLSRPDGFGKTITVSALENILRGRRELFEGLAIDRLEYGWEPHPVLRLDMNGLEAETPGEIEGALRSLVRGKAQGEGIELEEGSTGGMLLRLIDCLYRKNGKKAKVAVLVDDCNAPAARFFDRPEAAENVRGRLFNFFLRLGGTDKIGHLFMTGVGRFRNISLHSGLNFRDMTFSGRYAAICGFSETDLDALLAGYGDEALKGLIEGGDLPEGSGPGDLRRAIADWYGGYSWDGKTMVLNPWSTLSLFKEAAFRVHWPESDSLRFLMDMIRKGKDNPHYSCIEFAIKRMYTIIDHIDSFSPTALMLQAGYLTVKEKVYGDDMYRLGFPNREAAARLAPELLSTAPPVKTPEREALAERVLEGLLGLEEGVSRGPSAPFWGDPDV